MPQLSIPPLQFRDHSVLHLLREIQRPPSFWAGPNIAWLDKCWTVQQYFFDRDYSLPENFNLWQFCQLQAEGERQKRVYEVREGPQLQILSLLVPTANRFLNQTLEPLISGSLNSFADVTKGFRQLLFVGRRRRWALDGSL